jgi:hypothetical protein
MSGWVRCWDGWFEIRWAGDKKPNQSVKAVLRRLHVYGWRAQLLCFQELLAHVFIELQAFFIPENDSKQPLNRIKCPM